jgi:lycopene cyclase domain-containing protein
VTGGYAAALVLSLAGMLTIDRRFALVVFAAPRRALTVLALGAVYFGVWDLAGIGAGVFFRGSGEHLVGLQLAPELPVEEVLFLALLCHVTLSLYVAAERWLAARAGRTAAAARVGPVRRTRLERLGRRP